MTSDKQTRSSSGLALVAIAAGGAAAVLGLNVLAGWYTHRPGLIQIHPEYAPMQYNTALGFVLCGIGLCGVTLRWSRLAAACGAVAGTIGLLTLIEYIAGFNLGIDELLMNHYITVETSHPGRMAPNTALCFVLFGAAILALEGLPEKPRRVYIVSLLGAAVTVPGWIACAGYLSAAPAGYAWGQMTQMALHTAGGFVILGTGLLALAIGLQSEPHIETTYHPRKERARVFIISLIVMSIVTITVSGNIIRELRHAAIEEKKNELQTLVRSWKELITAIAQQEADHAVTDSPEEAVIKMVLAANERFVGIGKTGEFIMARREGDMIVFLLARRHEALNGLPQSVPDVAGLAEPMRRALDGESGTLTGIDYRNTLVLSAFTPVHRLGWGLVAKMDMAEITAPFKRATFLALGTALIVIALGTVAFLITVDPTIHGLVLRTAELKREVSVRTKTEARAARLSSVLERSLNEIYIFDTENLHFVEVNRGARENLGYSVEELRELTPLDLKPRFTTESFAELIEPLRAGTAEMIRFTTVHRRKNKTEYPVEVHLQLMTTDHPVYVAMIIDITERQQAESALKESEARYRAIVEDQTELICRYTPDRTITFVNGAYCQYFAKTQEELMGHSFMPVIPDEDRERVTAYFASLGADNPVASHEHRVIAPDGEIRWHRWTNRVIFDESGNVIEFQGTGRDITDQRIAEEALRHTTNTLNSILDSASEYAIAATDLDLRIIHYNPAAERFFGYSAEEAIGLTVPEIHLRENVSEERLQHALETVERTGKWEYDVEQKRPDGSKCFLHSTVMPMRDEKGAKTGYVLFSTDVTEVVRSRETLENRSVELERSNADLQEFAYVASHDLQEPLRAIAGFVQLLTRRYKGKLDDKADQYMEYIVDGAARMQQLLTALLEYSRIDAKAKIFDTAPLEEILDDVIHDLRAPIKKGHAEITHDPLPVVEADRIQIRRVLQNLISNAIKFRGDSAPRVHISAQEHDDEWVLCVRDNGIGIDPQYFDRIFQIFQRLHLREEYPGNGVGLAVCKKIIERHGSRIWVESEAGAGSAFYFSLPQNDIAPEAIVEP